MTEAQQIKAIIAAAKSTNKVGIFIDDYKEHRFKTQLREGLPESDFDIEIKAGLVPGTRLLFVSRKQKIDPSAN